MNFEDGEGPDSRFARVMPIVQEHGAAVVALTIDEEGQARTADWKLRVAERLIATLTGEWGMRPSDILVDFLTFTLGTGQEESRRDGLETIEAIRRLSQSPPEVGTTLGLSNISFGLKPAARVVLNSVFLHECQKAGLTSAIVHASKILPMNRIPDEQREVALDLVYDRRDGTGYDPLTAFLDLFEGVDAQESAKSRAELLMELPLEERLQRRIIDGEKNGLEADLDAAMAEGRKPLAIVNDTLLSGMKVVGELFGSGEMQLPFVLQSAEVMKTAVAHLEPHMEKVEGQEGKGKIVLATVKGDVHDIGKNLVDIILSNNGYTVINLGIKQPVSAILDAAQEHDVDVVGMSGLLVKSTVVMKENLLEMNSRGIASTYPVILGGAALTRAYVEQDLDEVYEGEVKYARDAFEGLRLMDELMAVKRGAVAPGGVRRARREGRRAPRAARPLAGDRAVAGGEGGGRRAGRALRRRDRQPRARAAVLGLARVQGHRAGRLRLVDRRAGAVPGPVGAARLARRRRPDLRGARRDRGPAAAARAARAGAGRGDHAGRRRARLLPGGVQGRRPHRARPRRRAASAAASPSRGSGATGTCACRDFWRPQESGETDVVAFQVVTMGRRVSEVTGRDVRPQRLPRVPRAARPVGAAHRGARGALARPGARRARLRRRGRARPVRHPRSSSTAARGTPGATRPAPTSRTRRRSQDLLRVGADRRRAVRGVPAHARAVDVGDHRAPPRGQVLRGAVKELVVELLPASLSGDRRDQLLYVLALGLLGARHAAVPGGAARGGRSTSSPWRSPAPGRVAWLLSNGPGEGGDAASWCSPATG